MGRRAEAEGVLAEVQRLARGRRDPAARALASAARAIPLLVDGRRAEALQGLRQALQLAPTCGLAHRLPQWLTLAGHCAGYLGLYPEAERLLRQAVAAAAEPRSPALHAQAVAYLSTTLICAGRPHEARQLLESTWDPSLPLLTRARLAMSLADACLYAGDAAALAVTLARARDVVRLAHHLSLELTLNLIETAHCAHQGQSRRGWALVNTTRARALAGGMHLFERALKRYAAELWAAEGQRAPALHWLARVRRDTMLSVFERAQAQRLWDRLAPDEAEAAAAQDGPDADFGAQVQAMAAST
jgi:tetratricopeptide (TPR) repeat protein